jgi:glutathione reductase (NADPH)
LQHFQDPDLVDQLVQRTCDLGVDVQLQTEVKGIVRSSGNGLAVNAFSIREDVNRPEEHIIETDMVVHGAGRVPDIEGLDLEAAGIEYDQKKGIKINEYLQSVSNPAVYAAGDVAAIGGPQLTPVAVYDGKVVASNLLKGNHVKPNYNGVPSVVFTIPPLASVGLQECAAKQQGLQFRTNFEKNTSSWYSSRRIGERYSGFKVLVEEREGNATNPAGNDDDSANGGRILGAHLLGIHAEEIINIFALAIRLGLNTTDIKDAILSYPTKSSDISYMLKKI